MTSAAGWHPGSSQPWIWAPCCSFCFACMLTAAPWWRSRLQTSATVLMNSTRRHEVAFQRLPSAHVTLLSCWIVSNGSVLIKHRANSTYSKNKRQGEKAEAKISLNRSPNHGIHKYQVSSACDPWCSGHSCPSVTQKCHLFSTTAFPKIQPRSICTSLAQLGLSGGCGGISMLFTVLSIREIPVTTRSWQKPTLTTTFGAAQALNAVQRPSYLLAS